MAFSNKVNHFLLEFKRLFFFELEIYLPKMKQKLKAKKIIYDSNFTYKLQPIQPIKIVSAWVLIEVQVGGII